MFRPFTSSDKMPDTNHLIPGQSDTLDNGTIVSKWYYKHSPPIRNWGYAPPIHTVCVLITRQLPSGVVESYHFDRYPDYPNHRQSEQNKVFRWLVGAVGAEYPW